MISRGKHSSSSRERPKRRFIPRRRVCGFCVDHVKEIDYKDGGLLRRYVTERFKIDRSRKTGTCASHQRDLARAIKRARHIALLPFTQNRGRFVG